MPRFADRASLLTLDLDREGGEPLHRQAYNGIARLILAGALKPGERLPSSRAVAADLGLSRATVLAALDQLASEGYVEARAGSGVYVARSLPDDRRPAAPQRPSSARPPALSARGRLLTREEAQFRRGGGLFAPGVPDVREFPFALWARLLAKSWRSGAGAALDRDPAGFAPLREAIGGYLGAVRGVRCPAERIVIVSGTRQAMDLAARLLLDPGDVVAVENPGFPGIRASLIAAGAALAPVPVDDEGLSVSALAALRPAPRLVCVTPSREYPLGVAMSLPRRLALLDWARQADAWIFEDYYDSEFRYAGRPLAALASLDDDGRVLHVGTFSKALFPTIRLAYMAAPEALVSAFLAGRTGLDDHPAPHAQPALAAFMAEGHFAQHLRRMRRLYSARQQVLLAALERRLAGALEARAEPSGMHLIARLGPAVAFGDAEAARRAAARGFAAPPLSAHYLGPAVEQGLLLGYAATPEAAMDQAVARLVAALDP